MEQKLNILWQKTNSVYIDIFAIHGSVMDLNRLIPIIDEQFQNAKSPEYQKNTINSEKMRDQGKAHFSEEKYLEAMKSFNASLVLAAIGTNKVALAYANRSSCFFNLKMLDECLVDIELAKQAGYPMELMHKLDARISKCMKLKSDEHYQAEVLIPDVLKLDFNEHPEFAGVADCLEIRQNDEFGRHVITTRDLEIGQTILVEHPFAITPERFYFTGNNRCLNCFKEGMNFITCKNCIGAFFCNDDCLVKSFHKYDCNMPGSLSRKKTFELVLHMFYNINAMFPNVDEFMVIVEKLWKGETPVGLTTDQKKFCALFQLVHNHRKLTDFQLDRIRAAASVTIITLTRFAAFDKKYRKLEHKRFLQHLILHLFHIAEHAVELHEISFEKNAILLCHTLKLFANAMYPFGCYFNHSCVPNISWFNVDGRLICKVIRPIKKGQQVFRSYL